jgi:outer membrane protein OmpA-like peptidoglycan-associated protein
MDVSWKMQDLSSMRSAYKPFIRNLIWPIFVVLLFSQRTDGQNIVPNSSFEDVNICSEFNQPCSPSAWFFLSRKLTTGYFPRYPSATGARHLQIVSASRETANRQYWETMLLSPIQAGARYMVSLKVAGPANGTGLSTHCPNLRDIGLWFTSGFVFVQGDSILQPRSYLSFINATIKDLKNGWFEIRKEFIPNSTARFLIVGNFSRATNADIMEQRNWPSSTIDILVDDVTIIPEKPASFSDYQKVKDSLYSISSRHSDNIPRDSDLIIIPHPNYDSLPDNSGRNTQRLLMPPHATDTIVLHNIQFDFDKYLMRNPDTLQRYRNLLTRTDIKKIKVVGFTDDIGSEKYNQDLSEKRAREIVRLLSSKFNISPALIDAEGRGISTSYPTTELNRRVEIYIFHR